MKIHIIKQGDTLYHLAQKYHVTVDEILSLNPGLDPQNLQVGRKIRIPSSSTGHHGGASHHDIIHQHVVKSGDTLWKLSQEWGVSLAELTAVNGHIKNPNVLMVGEIVNIPKKAGHSSTGTAHTTSVSALFSSSQPQVTFPSVGSVIEQLIPGLQIHTVADGETLYEIANSYGITLDELLALNPSVGEPTQLQIGTKLLVPKAATPPSGIPIADIGYTQSYTVQPGDTLWKLSQAWNVSLDAIIAANSQLSNPDQLTPGQVIQVPHNVSINLGGGITAQSANMISTATGKKNTGVIAKSDTNVKGTAATPIKVQVAPTAKPKTEVAPTKVTPQAAPKAEVQPTKVQPQAAPKVEAQAAPKVQPQAAPKVQPQATKVEAQATKVEAQATKVEAQATKVQPQATKVEAQATKVQPQATKVEAQASKIEAQATKVQPQATKVEGVNSQAATNNVAPYSNKVAPLSNNVAPLSNNVAPYSNNTVAPLSNNVAPYSNKVAPMSNNVAPYSNKVAPLSNNVAPLSNNVAPLSNKLAPYSNKVAPLSNNVAPYSTNTVAPLSNNVAPYSNTVSPLSNNVAPYSNTVAPLATKVEAANKIMPQATKVEAANKIMPQATKVEAASKIMPQAMSNNMAPYSNHIAPYSNTVAPMSNNVAPYSNTVAPMSNNVAPYSNTVAPMSNNVAPMSNNVAPYSNKIAPTATKVEAANKIMPQSTAPITTKVQSVANKVAPTANKMAPNENFVYAGYKPLPAELEQQSYKTNISPTYSNASANTTAYASNQKPVVYASAYNNNPYYYGYSNQGYSNQVLPAQGNWGYPQPFGNNAPGGWNGTPILAQSAMYPPVNIAPQQHYYQPWQADCGCGGNQAYTMNQSAGKFAAMNESAGKFAAMNESAGKFAAMNEAATKIAPAAKGKRSGKKVNITAAKKKPKQSKGSKPWLNV